MQLNKKSAICLHNYNIDFSQLKIALQFSHSLQRMTIVNLKRPERGVYLYINYLNLFGLLWHNYRLVYLVTSNLY